MTNYNSERISRTQERQGPATIWESPWGYEFAICEVAKNTFLHREPNPGALRPVRYHANVRDMFSVWRLGLVNCHGECQEGFSVDPLETIRHALYGIYHQRIKIDLDAFVGDSFDGSLAFFEFHLRWLEHKQLVRCAFDEKGDKDVFLSAEGLSALYMLQETQPGSNIDWSPRAIAQRQEQADGERIVPLIDL